MNEVKAKLFAMYLGQKVYCHDALDENPYNLLAVDLGIDALVDKGYLLLRPISDISDDEAIQVARFAHQMPNAPFKVARRDEDIMHVEYLDNVVIRHHISIRYKYATVGANLHFEKTETDESKSFTHNIGSINNSAERPIPYIAIVDYLRGQGFALPFTAIVDGKPVTYSVEQQLTEGIIKF